MVSTVASGFHHIGNAVAIRVAVRIEIVHVKVVGHTVAIVVGVGSVRDTVTVEVTGIAGVVGHTGIVVIRVVQRI